DGFLDTAELLRAGLMLRLPEETPTVSLRHEETAPVSSDVSAVSLPALERLIDVLQRELDAARLLLREAHERETQLLQMLSQMQSRHDRLLALPRPIPPETPQDARGATHAPRHGTTAATASTPPGDPRGATRRRIVALLQEHPE